MIHSISEEEMIHSISEEELLNLKNNSADPAGRGRYINKYENVNLTDSELIRKIEERNTIGKDTYKLRAEYRRRLNQRGLNTEYE